MILDKDLQVSTAQVVTASAGSTDVIDLKQDRDVGIGEPMYLVCVLSSVSGTSPTLKVEIETDDNSSFTSAAKGNSSPTLSPPVDHTMVVVPLGRSNERYLRAYYTVGGTTPSVTIDAYLTHVPPAGWQAYQGAIPC